MSNKIILKKSSVVAKVPTVGDIDYGELAINYADGKLYYKAANNTIGSFLSAAASTAVTSVDGNIGDITPTQLLTAIEKVDGTGSGLDADLLDGYHGSVANTVSTAVIRDTTGNINATALTLATDIGTSKIVWNATEGTFDTPLYNGVTLQNGQEIHVYAKASTTITNGQVVMFAGAQGSHILVAPADATSVIMQSIDGSAIVGVATQDIAIGAFGYITWFGNISDIDTSAWAEGTILYFNPAVVGGLTPTMPVAPNSKIIIAACTRQHAVNGRILVRPSIYPHLNELSDVHITSVTGGDLISWNATNGRWENKSVSTLLDSTYVNATGDTMTGALSIGNGTITTSTPALALSQTWNAVGTTFTAASLNVTDTASAAGSLLMDLQVGGVSKFKVDKTGKISNTNWLVGSAYVTLKFDDLRHFQVAVDGSNIDFAVRNGYGGSYVGTSIGSTSGYGWSSGGASAASRDLALYRDAANTLAQRNSTNAQTFRVYNTYTDASNYELATFGWNSNVLEIGTAAAGTGTRRQVKVNYSTTIDGNSRTNVPALNITNVGAGTGGLIVGALNIGHQQDWSRLTAFYVANKALLYHHGGSGIASQGIHRFAGDANSGTSAGVNGSIVDILAPSTATNIFQCRQSDETLVYNVAYNGTTTIAQTVSSAAEKTTLATVTQTQIASFAVASFRSAKLLVQSYDSVTGEVQISEMLVAHNGTVASATEYGVVYTGAKAIASFDVDISAGNVRLLATRTTANSTQYKVSETLMIA